VSDTDRPATGRSPRGSSRPIPPGSSISPVAAFGDPSAAEALRYVETSLDAAMREPPDRIG